MKDNAWILKLNILVVALILVIFFMSKTQNGGLQKYFSGLFGNTPRATQVEEAGR